MAVLDMFGRPIEPGDLVLQLVPRRDPFLVQEVIEPSLLNVTPAWFHPANSASPLTTGSRFIIRTACRR